MRWYKPTIERRKTGLIYWDNEWSSGCYTLYAPQTGGGLVKLISIAGDIVHEWKMPEILDIMEVIKHLRNFILIGICGMVAIL